MSIDSMIEGVIGKEGGYSNNPDDTGGETMWGITARVARDNGYTGAMRALPRAAAKRIYFQQYVQKPGFALVALTSEKIAEELVDTGVNMGPTTAAPMLQRSLNALNRQGKDFKDLKVDGDIGPGTIVALRAYLALRGVEGEMVLLKALNCLQGEKYIRLAEGRAANETFLYGWLRGRVGL